LNDNKLSAVAAKRTSIVGNILDKGVGILGSAIHSIRAIECILPDGSLYYDGVNSLCNKQPSPPIRVGVGPLLEGLFIQCDFAIVTAITIVLYHQPKYISTFYISAPNKDSLSKTIDIYNQYNTLNGQGSLLSGRWSKALLHPKKIDEFSYSCVIASMDASIHQARKKVLKKLIRNAGLKAYSIDDKNIERLKKLFEYDLIKKHLSKLVPLVNLLGISLNYSKGYSDEHNLKEQYQLLKIDIPKDKPLELARDGIGFIWYIVLFAATADNLLSFNEVVSESAKLHQIIDTRFHVLPYKSDLLVGLARVAFVLSDRTARDKAHAFYLELLNRGLEKGFVPHRVPIPIINSLVDLNNPYWKLIRKIKNAVDPNNIIAPDKYWSSS
jgi:4-cresol dehydrogenase (hydroxylating) flavoprotein subunit